MNVLAVTNDNNLVRYSSLSPSFGGDIIAKNVESTLYTSCSVSQVVKNRYVFMVGGATHGLPSRDVFFYDLHQVGHGGCKRTPGPLLHGPKSHPTLIVMGSKLFAFSYILGDSNPDHIWQSRPPYEVLDTVSDCWQWCTPQPFPEFPPPFDDNAYNVVSYVADESIDTLYLSLGNFTRRNTQGTLCITYNTYLDKWDTRTHLPLPFYGEGKVFDNLFYGFPCGMSAGDFFCLGVYKLYTDSTNHNSFSSCWVELRRYSLDFGVSGPFPSYLESLYVLRKDVVAIIRARATGLLEKFKPHLLEFDVVKLVDTESDVQASFGSIIIDHHSSYRHNQGFDAIVGVCWGASEQQRL
ncbi:uncharacterized protein LOC141657691 [Silene latifolia]|uniref:uncharacterized protein LOC141657691 n=1 Tax=Silene latifolia TaxID=37657 RepID=UPI003D7759F4